MRFLLLKFFCFFSFISVFSPAAFGQWHQATSLTGGAVVTDIIKFNGGMYSTLTSSGVFKSVDNGNTWLKQSIPNQPNGTCFVIHKSKLIAVNYGISFHTSDGNLWNEGLGPEGFIYGMISDGVKLFAATSSGIFKSIDDGMTWSIVEDEQTQNYTSSIAVNGSTILATPNYTQGDFILKSEDGGSTWSKIITDLGTNSQVLFKGSDIYLNVLYKGIYKSSDNGDTWQLVHSESQEGDLYVNSSKLYYFTSTLSTSADGLTWENAENSYIPYSRERLYITDTNLFMGTWGGGIFRSPISNSLDWQPINEGIAVHQINDIEVIGNKILAGTGDSFVLSSDDEGITWDQKTDVYGLRAGSAGPLLTDGSDLFAFCSGMGIQRSSDLGGTWILESPGLSSYITASLIGKGNFLFAGTDDGVYRSEDRGKNWIKKNGNLSTYILAIHSDDANLYAATTSGLYLSNDDGESWEKISTQLPNYRIVNINHIGAILFVATTGGLYKTQNGGASWDLVAEESEWYASYLEVKNNSLFVSKDKSLFVSYDEGETLLDIGGGLDPGVITSVAFTDKNIVVGMGAGSGIWLREKAQVLAPSFKIYTGQRNFKFYINEPIYIESDQELRTMAGDGLSVTDIENYVQVRTITGEEHAYTSTLSADKKMIGIYITNPTEGDKYKISISPLKNNYGLTSFSATSPAFTAIVNHLPNISDIELQVTKDNVLSFSASTFGHAFVDVDSILVKVKIVTVPQHGSLVLNEAVLEAGHEIPRDLLEELKYVPANGFFGEDQWKWNGFDSHDYALNDAEVNIEVVFVPVNHPPVVIDIATQIDQDEVLQFSELMFIDAFSDEDSDELTKIKLVTLPAHGTLKLNEIVLTANTEISHSDIGQLKYIPTNGFSGNDQLKWNGFDSQAYSSNNATVKIQIVPAAVPANHFPIIADILLRIDQGNTLIFSESMFTSAFSDIDADVLTKVKIVTLPEHGALSLNEVPLTANEEISSSSIAQLKYVPANGFSGEDQWKWNAFDSQTYSLTDAAVRIQVESVTGISEEDPASIRLFPNPFTSVLHIHIAPVADDIFVISIMDVLGVEVKRIQPRKFETSLIAELDLSDFPSGMYFVKMKAENGEILRKVIKR